MSRLSNAKKKAVGDVLLNIVAAALPIGMLQLIIYPQIAKNIGGDEYGLMLTIYSVWIMLSNSLGNVLNNIKLLRVNDYEEINDEGDVALLLRRWLALSSAIVFIVIWIYVGQFDAVHIIVGTFTALLIMLKAYLDVGFRINLNYVAILITNVLLSLGFLLGFFLFKLTSIWEFVFLIGYLLSVIYNAIKTGLLKERPKKTILFSDIRKDAYSLVVAAIINTLINYADKLVLYPLMGGTVVAIYYTATILGKITGMLTGPINSVFLSYISRWDNSRTGFFFKMLSIGTVICVFGYGLTLLLAKPVIGLLFPQCLDQVLKIMPLTTLTIMLTVLTSLLQPFVLKYCKMQWQIAISAAGSAAYFAFALLLWHFMGLKGFCIGTIIGVVVKLVIMIAVYSKTTRSHVAEE